jgi:hypothetical protein
MSSASTTALSIMNVPRTVDLSVGEGRLIMLPKFKFSFNWWAGDPFMEFCNDTILRVLENLIINQVLICRKEIKTVPYRDVLKQNIETDQLCLNIASHMNLGFIEEKVVKIVSGRTSISAKTMIDYLITDILVTRESVTNPWREVVGKIIEKNSLNAWTFNYSKNLLGQKIEVVMSDSFEETFGKIANQIEEQCAHERVYNTEFAKVSRRIYSIIDSEMQSRHDTPDGGS